MKKRLLLTICFSISLISNAQLKVHDNGNVSIHNSYSSSLSNLSIGSSGDSLYTFCCSGIKNGIRGFLTPRNTELDAFGANISVMGNTIKTVYGIKGITNNIYNGNNNSPASIGVFGRAQTPLSGNNLAYGIYGQITANYGAAVIGQTVFPYNYTINEKYAGLFIGKTKVEGNLEVTGTIQGTLLSNAIPEGNGEDIQTIAVDETTVAKKLSHITTITYHHVPTEYADNFRLKGINERGLENTFNPLVENEEIKESIESDLLMEQIANKTHYAISPSQLEQVFPDLVYEDNNGAKHINYLEMIPLLVQSINELQSQINTLTGKEPMKKTPSITAVSNTSFTAQAMLYQNTPNPFNERTTIRFTLPEDAQNASICIFDMSGKMLKQIPVNSGMQSIVINGYELAAGMYLYSLVIGGQEVDTKRMILSK